MACAWLNVEFGVREQLSELGYDARSRVQVDLSGEQQHRRGERGECRASGSRVECALSAEDGCGFLVPMTVLGRLVSLRRCIPSAVEEGLDGRPAVVGGVAGHDCFKRCEGGPEPGLVLAESRDVEPALPGGRDADGKGARSDQSELAHAFWMPGDIQRREVRTCAVGEQVQLVEIKVLTDSLDIIDESVTAVGGGILRYRGPAGAPLVHHDQLPMRRQAAEFTEVSTVLHRAARQADHRDALSEHVVSEVGSITRGVDRHGQDHVCGISTKATDYPDGVCSPSPTHRSGCIQTPAMPPGVPQAAACDLRLRHRLADRRDRKGHGGVARVGGVPDSHFEHPRLAAIYDALDPDRSDLTSYLGIAQELGARQVLDVGCGTGTFALLLAEEGLEVIGVDPAVGSLQVAQGKPGADRVRWIHGDAMTLPPMQVDLATMTGNVAQAIVDPTDWAGTLRGVHGALRPGGRLVFETRDPANRAWEAWNRAASYRTTDVPGVGTVEHWVELVDVDGPLVRFRSTFAFASDGQVLTSDSTLRFRQREEIEGTLVAHSFTLEDMRSAPDRPGRELVFVARRPG